MSKLSVYLNFDGQCQEAFTYYKSIFNATFSFEFVHMKDMPPQEGMPPLSEEELNKVMHVGLRLFEHFEIMGCDIIPSIGHSLTIGNNAVLNLELDSRKEADKLYQALADANKPNDCMPPSEQFWGYWGVCIDRFGIRWMFNVMNPDMNGNS